MSEVYYLALIVERDILAGREVVVEAGVDLLAGPFATEGDAVQAMGETCARYPRQAAFAAMAMHISVQGRREPPAHIAVLPVHRSQCERYAARHRTTPLPWPPPLAPVMSK